MASSAAATAKSNGGKGGLVGATAPPNIAKNFNAPLFFLAKQHTCSVCSELKCREAQQPVFYSQSNPVDSPTVTSKKQRIESGSFLP
jgi:hypothetical protein